MRVHVQLAYAAMDICAGNVYFQHSAVKRVPRSYDNSRQGKQIASPVVTMEGNAMGFGIGHAITGYGLYLNDEETYAFVEKYGSEYGLYDDEIIDDAAATDAIEQDMDALFLANERITDCALSDFSGNEVEGEDGLFLFCKKHGGIVASDATNLYASMDDLADELRASYGAYLPSGFDYAEHVRMLRVSMEWY